MLAALLCKRRSVAPPVPDVALATPGRPLRMRHAFRVESEADKLARRIAQGTVADPTQQEALQARAVDADALALAQLQTAALQADSARAQATAERQRARVAELQDAEQRAAAADQRARLIDAQLAAELVTQRQLQMAYEQQLLVLAFVAEAEAQARIEEFDLAFIVLQMAEA